MLSGSVFWMHLVLLFASIIKYSWDKCFPIPFSEVSFQLYISPIFSLFFPSWHEMLLLPFQKVMNFVSSINLFQKERAQMDQHPDHHLSGLDELCLSEALGSILSGHTCFNISFKSCYANHILLNWKMCIL